jgi:asparagine synthase (glutamine-hydrolysing)
VEFFDEPFADSSALPTYYLAKMTRQHVTVALNGDGGDETHAGYQRYWLDRMVRLYEKIPGFFRVPMEAAFSLLREPVNVPIERNWLAGLKRLSQVTRSSPKASILRWGSYFSDEMKLRNYTEEMKALINCRSSEQLLAEGFDRAEANSFLDRTLYVDVNNYLAGDLMVKADRMTMANSLEGRSPFLDYEMMEWVARLPENMKLNGRAHKYLLKRTFSDMLPPLVKQRSKQGFGIPVGKWFRQELRPLMEELLMPERFQRRRIFKPEFIRKIIAEHVRGKLDHGKRIWALVMLELWFRQYID